MEVGVLGVLAAGCCTGDGIARSPAQASAVWRAIPSAGVVLLMPPSPSAPPTAPRIKPRSIRKIKSIKTRGATCGEMSTPRHLHPLHENRAHGLGAVVVGIRSHGRYAPEHVLEVAGDGDFMHRVGNLAALYPKAAGAA